MANVESPFNPDYERKHEETYDFRGPDAPSAGRAPIAKEYSKIAQNTADIFKMGIEGRDAYNQESIRTDLTERVDAVRDAWIGQSTSSGAPDANTPADLTKQLEIMKKRTAQYSAGNISDRHYWAQMETIARAVRSKHPGYREHIDNVMQNLTGATPANALQRSIASEATDAVDNETKRRNSLLEKMVTDEDGFTVTEEMYSWDYNSLAKAYNQFKVVNGDMKRRRQSLEDAKAVGDWNQTNIDNNFSKDIKARVGLEYNTSLEKFDLKMLDSLKEGELFDPETQRALEFEVEAIGKRIDSIYSEVLNEDVYTGDTAAGVPAVSVARREQERQFWKNYADGFKRAVSEGNWTTVKSMSNTLKMMTTGEALNMAGAIPEYLELGAANEIGGQAAVTALANSTSADGKSFTSRLDQSTTEYHLNKMINPKYAGQTPIIQSMKAIKDNDNLKEPDKMIAVVVDRAILPLTGKDAAGKPFNLAMKERAAENIFSPENRDFLAEAGPNKRAIFMKYNSPEVAKSMIELRNSSPKGEKLWQDYQTWRNYSFNALYKNSLNTMNSITKTDQSMNLQMDGETGLIIPQSRTSAKPLPWPTAETTAIADFNSIVRAMTPAWEAEGLNPGEESLKLITNAGINLNAVKQNSFLEEFFKSVGEAAATGAENVKARRAEQGIGTDENRIPDMLSGDRSQSRMNLGVGDPDAEGRRSTLTSDREDYSRVSQFSDPGFLEATKFMVQNQDAVKATGDELRELYKLHASTENPATRKMIEEEILSLKNNGVYGAMRAGQNFRPSQKGMEAAEQRGTLSEQDFFTRGQAQRNSSNIDDEQGIQDIVEFLRTQEYTPGLRESTNIEDRRPKNEREAKEMIDEYFRLRDQAIALAKMPGGSMEQQLQVRQDAKAYNNIIGKLAEQFPGAYPEVYEMIQRVKRKEIEINERNSVDGALRIMDYDRAVYINELDKLGTYTPGNRESTNVVDWRKGQPKDAEEYAMFIQEQNNLASTSANKVGEIRAHNRRLDKVLDIYNKQEGTSFKREDVFNDKGFLKDSAIDDAKLFEVMSKVPYEPSPVYSRTDSQRLTGSRTEVRNMEPTLSAKVEDGLANVGIPRDTTKKLLGALDMFTGIISGTEANAEALRKGKSGPMGWQTALEAALTVIPGGRAAGAAKTEGKAALELVKKTVDEFPEAKKVLDDWAAEMTKDAAAQNQKFAEMQAKYGEGVTTQISMNVLEELPPIRSNPLDWTKEQATAVANVLGRTSYLKTRPGQVDEATMKQLEKLSQDYKMFAVEGGGANPGKVGNTNIRPIDEPGPKGVGASNYQGLPELNFIPGVQMFKHQLKPFANEGIRYAIVDNATGRAVGLSKNRTSATNQLREYKTKKGMDVRLEDIGKMYREAKEFSKGDNAVTDASAYQKWFSDVLATTLKKSGDAPLQMKIAPASEYVTSTRQRLIEKGTATSEQINQAIQKRGAKYAIVDKSSNRVVDWAQDLKSAIRKVDNRDNKYGSYNFRHEKIDD